MRGPVTGAEPSWARRNRTKLMAFLLIAVFPAALVLFTLYNNRNYALISLFLVVMALVPFLMLYERKRPQPREWIPLAVMAAIAAVGRAAFAGVPHFKPVSAIVIITAMVFGPEAGFLTGAVSALASNLFFGQGPWTPWQMFSWGLIGFLAGVLAKRGWLRKKWQLFLYGSATGFLYGWIMNIWAGMGFLYDLTWQTYLMLGVSSFTTDLIHSVSTVIFLWLLADSWVAKLRRVKYKFGILTGP